MRRKANLNRSRIARSLARRYAERKLGRPDSSSKLKPEYAFLIEVGLLLHRHGTPSYRLERVLTKLSRKLGIEGTFLYTPTTLTFSFCEGDRESIFLRRIDSGNVAADKLIGFDETLEAFEAGRINLHTARQQLAQIDAAPPPYPFWLTAIGSATTCGSVAVLLGGGWLEVFAAVLLGMLTLLLDNLHRLRQWEVGLLEPLAGLAAGLGAVGLAQLLGPLDDRLVTLAALIVIIPGLRITVALTELAVGHLSAGVARLAGAGVSLLTLSVGVGLAWRIADPWRQLPTLPVLPLPIHWQWVALGIAPLGFAVMFRTRIVQWPLVAAVAIAGFLTSRTVGLQLGPEGGAFLGAMVVEIGSNFYARMRNRPALVPSTPGIIMLVPGSIGYRSVTAFLDHDPLSGIDFATNMLLVAAALVGGILAANVIYPPKRIL